MQRCDTRLFSKQSLEQDGRAHKACSAGPGHPDSLAAADGAVLQVVDMAVAGGPVNSIVDILDRAAVGALDQQTINQADADGQTALHWCAWYGWASLVPRLLAHGCILSLGNAQGLSPLHLACARGHADTATLLLLSGAAMHATDCLGKTPFDYAVPSRLGRTLSLAPCVYLLPLPLPL